MQKIPTLFVRDQANRALVTREVTPGCEWVIAGEGAATKKFDGTCCMVRDGKLFKRYDAKAGKTPPGFIPAQPDADPITGHWPGWLAVGDGPEDRWHREAFSPNFQDGTYELCGPKVQGNPEQLGTHWLIRHGMTFIPECPRDFDGLKAFFKERDIEGVVWHHGDGRMVKIKGKDFGWKRPNKK